jgi:hypothetical protein
MYALSQIYNDNVAVGLCFLLFTALLLLLLLLVINHLANACSGVVDG